MSALELLSRLRSLEVRLWLEGDRLRYSAPRGVLTPALMAELKAQRDEVVAFLREAAAAASGGEGAIVPVPRDGELPLSFSQLRQWFLDRLEPGNPAYNIPAAVRLAGELDVAALEAGLNGVIARHEALRTTFPAVGGRAEQSIAAHLAVSVPVVDLSALPPGRRDACAQGLAAAEAARSFDLATGPLVRSSLLRLGPGESLFLVTLHHIVGDGWSIGVLVREMAALYAAATGAAPATLPPLALQYADFAAWQRSWLTGEALERLLTYWRRQLAGASPSLPLPTDRPRPAVQTYRGANRYFRFPAELAAAVAGHGRDRGTTPFMTLLAAFQALLRRTTGEGDVSVGTYIANRNRREVEGLIGFFVNILVLRTQLAAGATVGELHEAVKQTTLGAYARQDLPFEKLLEDLQPERDLSRTPLFQVMLVLQNVPAAVLELPRLTMERVVVAGDVRANFDLTLWVEEDDEGLMAHLEHNRDLFDPATVERLIAHFLTLVAGVTSGRERRLGELPLLGAAERHQLVVGWSDTGTAGEGATAWQLFAEQARRSPDAVAVATLPEPGAEPELLTYRRLHGRACRLARQLQALGVGPEVRVGLAARRSPEAMVGLLGVLAAGGAYVPIDPELPAERRAFLLADSAAATVLTLGEMTAPAGCGAVPLEGAGESPAAEVEPAGPLPANAAYVIYTSGSTGEPKGVVVEHRSLAHYVETALAAYGVAAGDRVLQFASLAFDASAEDIYPALACGATLVLRNEAMLAAPEDFFHHCDAAAVTVANLPTAYWHQLADGVARRLDPWQPAALRLVIVGGEQAVGGRLEVWRRRVSPRAAWVNTYGPTETTIVVTRWWPPGPGEVPARLPIGRPIAATSARVVDRRLDPVPLGVAGELALAGPGVARGYLGRPGLTAQVFVPDPFAAAGGTPGATAGGRLYRSGDLVRWRPAGELEFLGRADGQVKIRGFRVECGEIESRLRLHPQVDDAVVVTGRDPADGHRLLAYVVTAADPAPTHGELRRFTARALPDHMVPALFVPLAELPLTPTGKVDRRALPDPGGERPDLAAAYVAPRTPTEEVLAGIWSECLGVDRVGVEDNFFDLGGHSLLITQAIARIRDVFEVELPLRTVFEAPTVAQLAERVETASGAELEPIRPVPRDQPLPLTTSQERIWFLAQLDPESTAYHVPRMVRASGGLRVAALARAYGDLLERHEILRTSFPAVAGRPVQKIHPPGPFRMPVVDLTALPAALREEVCQELSVADGRRLFDLAEGPLLRALVVRLAADEHALIQTEHHLVHDGWAEGVLMGDLLALYTAAVEEAPSPLPPLPIQFADFAAWQRGWLSGEVLAEQVSYWRRHLEGAPPVLELPADRPRPAVPTMAGRAENFLVSQQLTAALEALSRSRGATLFMTMLAAFETLLYRIMGQDDMVVGTGVANRRRRETEGLLGMAINTLALRTDLSGDPPFRELLDRVREICLGAYAHQDMPFEKVVEVLNPERTPSYAPVFQLMFAFHDAPHPRLELPGLVLENVETHNLSSKFDLVVIVSPSPRGEGMNAHFEWATDLFDPTTMARMAHHWQGVMAAVAAEPELALSAVPYLSAAERWQLAGEWNDTAVAYPRDATVHALVAAQAAGVADRIALVAGDEHVSYGELVRRAGWLAHRLRGLGVGPDVTVGLAVERSAAMVVALLGILEAGGAYLPLDVTLPSERLAFMLADAGAAVVVAGEREAGELPPPGRGVEVLGAPVPEYQLLMLGGGGGVEGAGGGAPAPVAAGHLANIIYTSGSTGLPKGVGVPHRGVVRLVRETDWAPLGPEVVILHLAPISFDASTLEIWAPLLNGGRLVLYPPGIPTLEELGATLVRHRVTTLFLTTGLFHQMVESRLPSLAGVRHLMTGGDVVSAAHMRRALEGLGGTVVSDVYGPTENSTYTTSNRMTSPRQVGATVAIGRPIASTRTHVVDAALRPRGVGVPGELLTGGDGLARGYLGRPRLTAAAFVPDPFGGPGERLYKTGDLARWRAGGKLEFLGRNDFQVKVRGFRIELGEIEAVLGEHEAVEECVVLARQDRPGDKRLVAYVVPREGAAPEPAELAAHLRRRLAAYMVPAAFVVLAELPLTAHGKVDRRALPAPEAATAREGEVALPQTPVSRTLARIWSEVLGVEPIGVDDSFFDLGGHSLMATRVLSRVVESFGVQLAVRQLFNAPTVAALEAAVTAAQLARLEPSAAEGLLAEAGVTPADGAAAEGAGDLAPWVAALPAAERGRLQDLLALSLGAAGEAGPVPRHDPEEPAPLSFAQRRLWFLDQYDPGAATYNIPLASRLDGRLDPAALERSLGRVVERHEALRTTFAAAGDEPVQVVAPRLGLPLPVVDLGALGDGAAGVAQTLSLREAARPFDLGRGPLLRTTLLRLAPTEHRLLLTMHHIVSDGWSMGVLLREAAAAYQAFAAGGEPELPPLPVQYPDFALWQRGWLRGEVLEAQLAYWRRRLGGGVPALDLPTDRPRPAVQTLAGHRLSRPLPAALVEALEARIRGEGVTLFMVLLAGFKTLLHRTTGQTDLAVGFPIANREQVAVEGLIGFFVNTLVLRTDLAAAAGGPAPTFRQVLERVREVTLEAYAHQDLPFEMLVEELAPERDLSRTPLFQVLFVLQNMPLPTLELPGLTLSPLPTGSGTAKFDLMLAVTPAEEGLAVVAEYATELYDATTMARLLAHYETLLAGAVADPGCPLARLPLLPPAQRQQVCREWDDSARPFPAAATLPELFAEIAAARPEAVAVATPAGESLTYGELARRARRLAVALRGLGVGPDVPVGVSLPRSPEMVVSLLAILEAGGAYVPLDPDYPEERLAFMVDDVQAPVLLTSGELGRGLPAAATRVDPAALERGPAAGAGALEPSHRPVAENLAYIVYTSGSTGRPKGVGVSHRAVVRLVRGATYAHLGAEEVFLQLAPVAFDASTLELWGPLANGGRLVVFPPQLPSLAELASVVAATRVTTLWLTAGLFHQMAEEHLDGLAGVRQLLAGGDVLSPAAVARVLAHLPGCRLINGYGPTENTTFTCTRRLRAGDTGATVPIGRPITNTRVHVLDGGGSPVPAGIPGEVVTGGAGLARGYFNRPALTAQAFVPDAVGGGAGARLYRTGDRVRYRADGTLEFLGRLDFQVKVRGFRIELGEIEAALTAHPAVAEAVVLARQDTPGDKRLAAYVVPQARGGDDEAGEDRALVAVLRDHLEARLPPYMVPAAFVVMEELPLTPNGKVDRRALPAPAALVEPAASFVPPRTPMEEIVAGLFAQLLGGGPVGAHDDFFARGGHSLLATQAVSRLRRTLGVELPLRAFFEASTVAALAAHLEALQRQESGPPAPPLVPVARPPAGGGLPLSFAQERLWFLEQLSPGTPMYNVPAAISLAGELEAANLAAALAGVIQRHEALRTTFRAEEGKPRQVVAARVEVGLPAVDLSAVAAGERRSLAARLLGREAARPFEITRGPLLRATLLRLGEGEHVALLTLHHIISDGWSMGVLVRELAALYRAAAAGEPSPLPEPPIQYADFAVWQRGWLSGEVFHAQLAYWRQAIAGAATTLELPTDRPRPPVVTHAGARHPFALPPGLTSEVEALCRELGVTPFMVLLAAFQILLARTAGQRAFLVGTPIANRTRQELEGLIGFFVNTLALPARVDGDDSAAALVARVRESALGAFAHQDLPFETLVEAVRPERDLSRTPLFQVLFVLQNLPWSAVEMPGLTLEPFPVDSGLARFEWTLNLGRGAETFAGALEYNRDLFDAATAARAADGFRTLLAALVANPGCRVGELPLLSAAQRHQLVTEWSRSEETPPAELLPARLAARAEEAPDAVAAVFAGEALSYGELDRRARHLARRLRREGAGAEVLVALAAERGLDMVTALVGILAAGAAFLPLDPTYPPDRLTTMLEDSGAPILLAPEALRPRLGRPGVQSLDPGEAADEAVDRDSTTRPDPGHLAYVIYTSGSTGRPKGVALTHGGLANLVAAQVAALGLGPGDRVLQFAAFSFDAAVSEIFITLASGATLVLAPADDLLPGAELAALLAAAAVTAVTLPPSALALLPAAPLPALATLLVAGEACRGELVDRWAPGRRMVDAYGPTEATVCATLGTVAAGAGRPAIGRPIANTAAYVLDAALAPVPAGVPGELYLAGRGLARGYLGRPAETAASFLPHPFAAAPSRRLYASGDRVRFLATGELDFLGRLDHQVKVRGFRIELGEVEAVLGTHPGVSDAVAVAAAGPGEGAAGRLVAYYVAAGGEGPPAGELRRWLEERLPHYMVPSPLLRLDALPRTPGGKVDRRALPAVEGERPQTAAAYAAPRSVVEEVLAGIWAQVLGVERVGVEDDFFELGGHSLLAVELAARVRSAFRVELPLRSLFEATTVAKLARVLIEAEPAPGRTEKVATILKRLEGMTPEEVQATLAAKRRGGAAS